MDHTKNSFTHNADKSHRKVFVGWMTPSLRGEGERGREGGEGEGEKGKEGEGRGRGGGGRGGG